MRNRVPWSVAALAASVLAACGSGQSDEGAAQEQGRMGTTPGMEQRATVADDEHTASGTVNSVDAAAGTINLTHGPVASANWPAMTMTFKLADPSAGESLRPGQRVEFQFTIESGMAATVTGISPAD